MFIKENKRPFEVLKIKENLLKKNRRFRIRETCDELVIGNCFHRLGYNFQPP